MRRSDSGWTSWADGKQKYPLHATFFLFFLKSFLCPIRFPRSCILLPRPLLYIYRWLDRWVGGLHRMRGDGACPCCSGSQVWADNCQVCAAETDDYRVYCLSQAQSTLIQQSHLSVIYDSTSRSISLTSLYHSSYASSKLSLMSLLAERPPAPSDVSGLECWPKAQCLCGGSNNNISSNNSIRNGLRRLWLFFFINVSNFWGDISFVCLMHKVHMEP